MRGELRAFASAPLSRILGLGAVWAKSGWGLSSVPSTKQIVRSVSQQVLLPPAIGYNKSEKFFLNKKS